MLLKEYSRFKGHLLRPLGLEPPVNLDPHENGEYRLMEHIRQLPEIAKFNCVIDVGANIGDWTNEAVTIFRGTNIKRFEAVEPIPVVAEKTRARFASRSDVIVHETALAAKSGIASIFYNGGGGGTALPKNSKKQIVTFTVPVTTGDVLFASQNYVPYLIKIDCDGHDLHVLRGFSAVLQRARPIVQFEYCDFWIGGHSRLKEACEFLYDIGYFTFKMFPDRLVRFRFNHLLETFSYQNIVAVPKEFDPLSARTIKLKSKLS